MAEILVDSYSESNYDAGYYLNNGGILAMGQSLTGKAGILSSCKFYLKKEGSPTGNAYAKLYTHTGTFGTSSVPTGSVIATSDAFDVTALTTSYGLKTITFSGANKITLAEGTKYCIDVEYMGGDASNKVHVGHDASSVSHAGNQFYYISSWVAEAGRDCIFYVYAEPITTGAAFFLNFI